MMIFMIINSIRYKIDKFMQNLNPIDDIVFAINVLMSVVIHMCKGERKCQKRWQVEA